MEAFIAHYMSPHLIGFDFDIEHAQSEGVVASLVQPDCDGAAKAPEAPLQFHARDLGRQRRKPGKPERGRQSASCVSDPARPDSTTSTST